jgi:hypothetical protein
MTPIEEQPVPDPLKLDRVAFSIPLLDGEGEYYDLENTLTSLSGVGHVRVDEEAHSVSIDFDPDFTNPSTLELIITRSGYPISEDGAKP